ncbi:zinc-binding dehydrogenase [Streptacidiphilus monticola]
MIQLARWAGATVVSTVSSPEKARLAAAAGAHHVIDYREGDPAGDIREVAPDGVDLVAEVALGANLALDLAVLRTRGTIATYANDGGMPVELDVLGSMVLNAHFHFLVLFLAGPEARAAAVEDVAAAVRDGALPVGEEHGLPLVRFPLDRTADAHRAVENRAVGKVLVDIGVDARSAAGFRAAREPAWVAGKPLRRVTESRPCRTSAVRRRRGGSQRCRAAHKVSNWSRS